MKLMKRSNAVSVGRLKMPFNESVNEDLICRNARIKTVKMSPSNIRVFAMGTREGKVYRR